MADLLYLVLTALVWAALAALVIEWLTNSRGRW